MKQDDCVVGVVAANPFGQKGDVFLCSSAGFGRLARRHPAAFANLTPTPVSKTFKTGPAGVHERPHTLIRQSACPECNHPDTLYLEQRLTNCNVCGGSGIALRLA